MEFDIDECPDFGYRVAPEKEQEFYAFFDVAPLGILSDCGFDNLHRLHIEEGYDVCEHMYDGIKCENCEYSKQKYPWYPPITDDLIINLLLLVGTENLEVGTYSTLQDKYQILEYVKTFKPSGYSLIREILIGHLQEWSRM